MVRIGLGLVAGWIGCMCLGIALIALYMGDIEYRPTSMSIETIVNEGFPEPWYLEVTEAYIVFSRSEVALSKSEGQVGELQNITALVLNESQWNQLQIADEQGTTIDGKGVRLLVRFTGEDIERLWPEIKRQAESGMPITVAPTTMTLIGDSDMVTNTGFVSPDLWRGLDNVDVEQVRRLRHGEHFFSPWRFLLYMLFGTCLFYLAFRMLTNSGSGSEDDLEESTEVVVKDGFYYRYGESSDEFSDDYLDDDLE